jgi:hypothetical protein
VHFDGYASKWDEWIPAGSTRLITWGAAGAGELDDRPTAPAATTPALPAATPQSRGLRAPLHALHAAEPASPLPPAPIRPKAVAHGEARPAAAAAAGAVEAGSAVEAESVRGLWHPALVRAVRGGSALVHFDGYDSRYGPQLARNVAATANFACIRCPRRSQLEPRMRGEILRIWRWWRMVGGGIDFTCSDTMLPTSGVSHSVQGDQE